MTRDKRQGAGARTRRPRTLLLTALATVVLLAGWSGLVIAGALEGWLRRPLAPRSDPAAFAAAAKAQIARENVGNTAFVLLEEGEVILEHFESVGEPVDRDTLFQVASLSKWVTAWGVMKLVEEGRIDLDAPISGYLTRWKLPDGEYDESQVTVRRVLSHTAGLTDGLGYAGFPPGTPVQRLEDSLTRAVDASPGADGRVMVGAPPGESFAYSGGGYALLQLLIEEVSGQPFNAYMEAVIMRPLGMTRSTFSLADGETNLAQFFDTDGSQATHYRFSAPAAASLYTSAADMTRLLQAHVAGANGEPPGRGVLSPGTLQEMRRPHAYQFGVEIWGLGTILFAPAKAGSHIIGHDGSNEPAINTAARVEPMSGDGIVVLETGQKMLATEVAGEWVLWNSGKPDLFVAIADLRRAIPYVLGGCLAILAGAILLATGVVLRRRKAARSMPE